MESDLKNIKNEVISKLPLHKCFYLGIPFNICRNSVCPAYIGKKHESGCYHIKCQDTSITDLSIGFNTSRKEIKTTLSTQLNIIQQVILLDLFKNTVKEPKTICPNCFFEQKEGHNCTMRQKKLKKFLKTKAAKALKLSGWELWKLKDYNDLFKEYGVTGKQLYKSLIKNIKLTSHLIRSVR